MEAACISETSVDNYFTRQYIPEYKSELNAVLCIFWFSYDFSLQTAIISLNSIYQLIFAKKCGVLFEVRTEFLNIIKTSVGFKGLSYWHFGVT
jgi:hypothetical protein